jgi:hypothetical protein
MNLGNRKYKNSMFNLSTKGKYKLPFKDPNNNDEMNQYYYRKVYLFKRFN